MGGRDFGVTRSASNTGVPRGGSRVVPGFPSPLGGVSPSHAPSPCPCHPQDEHCSSLCPPDTFGVNCSGRCSCQHAVACSPIDGSCSCKEGGCEMGASAGTWGGGHIPIPTPPPASSHPTGWHGPNCSAPCPPGTWGPGCNRSCDCAHGATCSAQSGTCSCSPGWHGPRCHQPCPVSAPSPKPPGGGLGATVPRSDPVLVPPERDFRCRLRAALRLRPRGRLRRRHRGVPLPARLDR